ncbi:MAG TPA: hypothetical protein VGD01_04100 [Candidatus Elarobacter sp.]|jgi:hypothetical protein
MPVSRLTLSGAAAALAALTLAAAPAPTETSAEKIARALSAGPVSITAHAAVMDVDAKGTMRTLRKGTNGWTCIPGHPGVVGDDPMCGDAAAMQWGDDWFHHKAKPTNKVPGIAYMLQGGTDWSASDPFATKGTPIKEPPHWMILYPVTKSSGLATTPKHAGTWIMYAGTPWAHLMVNGQP